MISIIYPPEVQKMFEFAGVTLERIRQTVNDRHRGYLIGGKPIILGAVHWFDDEIVFVTGVVTKSHQEGNRLKLDEVTVSLPLRLAARLPAGEIQRKMDFPQVLLVIAESFGLPVRCSKHQEPTLLHIDGDWDGETHVEALPGHTFLLQGVFSPENKKCSFVWAFSLNKYKEWYNLFFESQLTIMSGFKYLTIFRSSLIQGTPLKVISDRVKIEMIREARSYRVPFQQSSILPEGAGGLIAKDKFLTLEEGTAHIVLTAMTGEDNPVIGRMECEDELDRMITTLSLVYKPEIFGDLVYRGWQLEEKKGVMEAWVKLSPPVTVSEKCISDKITEIKQNQAKDPDLLQRLKLMSRFYSKSLSLHPSEEKYILLWTILEVYPMKDTTNIRPIIKLLATITGYQIEKVREKLGIGRLYGIRCDLVHKGKLTMTIQEMGELFTKLENIVTEVLRYASGLPYIQSLEKYFT
jgi:hypothetical protein